MTTDNLNNLFVSILELLTVQATEKLIASQKFDIYQSALKVVKSNTSAKLEIKTLTDEQLDQLGFEFIEKLYNTIRG